MASILRQIVAGPRQRHAEAGLDLCYVTDNIVVTSGPSSTYPERAYRNPTDALVRWLDAKHGTEWRIWEFRAEGTGYPDSEVHDRVQHYPWPDHHPPPFQLIPAITAGMRNWLQEEGAKGRTVVVHCKAGKGRSGTVATSYLISQEGWSVQDALNRFTQRRMRPGFGQGVSIPSQIRWVGYVDKWTKIGKNYLERKAVVKEVHVWGLRDGVKVSVQGFVEEGRQIKNFHTFTKGERLIVDGSSQNGGLLAELAGAENETKVSNVLEKRETELIDDAKAAEPAPAEAAGSESGGKAVIFRPTNKITLETSDISIDFERRNRARYGWTMVTSVAHVWFNVFFEGLIDDGGDVQQPPKSGIFNIEWDAMDGIKGTSRKGMRAFDRMAVVWEVADDGQRILQPKMGEPVPETKPSDWRGGGEEAAAAGMAAAESGSSKQKDLGLRAESPTSADISKANSVRSDRSRAEQGSGSDGNSAAANDVPFESFQTFGLSDDDKAARTGGTNGAGIDQNDGSRLASVVEAARAAASHATGAKT